MDPLSLTVSATALVATAGKLVKLLHELHGTIEDAPILLASITAECSVVHTSLGILKRLYSQNASRQDFSDQVTDAFDIAFTSCALILSVLEKDVQTCLRANRVPQDQDAVKKFHLIMSKGHLLELVTQLRGQQQALTLLINSLQSVTLENINSNVADNRDILGGLARHARRLYVESVHTSLDEDAGSGHDESLEVNSVLSSTRFAFDSEILASRSYQKTLAYLHRLELRQAESEAGDTSRARSTEHPASMTPDSNSEATVEQASSTIASRYAQHRRLKTRSGLDTSSRLASPSPLTHNVRVNQHGSEIQNSSQTSSSIGNEPLPEVAQSPPRIAIETAPADTKVEASQSSPPDQAQTSALWASGPRKAGTGYRSGGVVLDQLFPKVWMRALLDREYQQLVRRNAVWVGSACSGKTCALLRVSRGMFPSGFTASTIFDQYFVSTRLDDVRFELGLKDTGDLISYEYIRQASYLDSHVVVMCFSIGAPDPLNDIVHELIPELDQFLPRVPRLLVGCQADLRDEPESLDCVPISYADALKSAEEVGAVGYVERSAKTGMGIGLLFEMITRCSILGESAEWREMSFKKRSSAISLSKMFRRRSQSRSGSKATSGSMLDPTFYITIDKHVDDGDRSGHRQDWSGFEVAGDTSNIEIATMDFPHSAW